MTWQLAQGTVYFRNEERRHRHGQTDIPSPAASPPLCPTCLLEVDPDGYCGCCGKTVRR